MNPLVEQMLNTKSRNDLELEILEQTFEEDCKCETNHVYLPCTGMVVGVVTSACVGASCLKCQNGVNWSKKQVSNGTICIHCNTLASECWTIRPI